MSRILVPTTGPDDWRRLLAKPDLHWAIGRSARTLAHAWEGAAGLPPEIHDAIASVHADPHLLFAIPEHKTALPGGRRESQSDLLALVGSADGLVVCTIEGKVDEPFGPLVSEWSPESTPGKRERFAYLCGLLGLQDCPPDVHYQLLHRSASAVIEAERFGARHAAMIVHSFSPQKRWFEAYAKFARLVIGPQVDPAQPHSIDLPCGRSLLLAWSSGDAAFLTR